MRPIRTRRCLPLLGLAVMLPAAVAAGADGPNPVPANRAELKQALENSKEARPRLPLPPLTAEEQERAASGDAWGVANNGRMRRHYLPAGFASGGFPRRDEPGMTLGYPFQTMLFWIVSRANNCTYCLGHQESKLAAAGVTEDRVAALDGDWAQVLPAERAAFAMARAMTLDPLGLGDAQVEALRAHYTEPQLAEIVYVVSSFNAMNRWTGALNIPQEHHREYLTPTAPETASLVSRVAPIGPSGEGEGARLAVPQRRPPLESRGEVEAMLAECRSRTPRIALIDPERTAEVMEGIDFGPGGPPNWARLLAYFPVVGKDRASILRAVEHEGSLDPMLRSRVAWVTARHDRAWYALGHAERRLRDQGQAADEIHALDGDRASLPEADRLAIAFAERLAVDPALVSEADFDGLRPHFTDHQIAELVAVVAESIFFNRLTEAAGLPLE